MQGTWKTALYHLPAAASLFAATFWRCAHNYALVLLVAECGPSLLANLCFMVGAKHVNSMSVHAFDRQAKRSGGEQDVRYVHATMFWASH